MGSDKYKILRTKKKNNSLLLEASKGSMIEARISGEEDPTRAWKIFEGQYKTFAPLTTAIDATSEIAVRNFHIEGEDERIVTIIEDLNNALKLRDLTMEIFKRLQVFGNAFASVTFSKKDGVVDIKLLPTIGMQVIREKDGTVKGYVQFKGSPNEEMFSTSEIIHFSMGNIDGSPYGMSLVQPLVGDIQTFLQAENQLPVIMQRYAAGS